jgi:hypothetical protein
MIRVLVTRIANPRERVQLRDSKNFKPNPPKNQKSFFERMKDYFE